MHEHHQGDGQRTIRRLADAHAVAHVYADRPEQDERDAVRNQDPRTHEQQIADEWAGGDGGAKLIRRVIIDRTKAGLPCDIEGLKQYDAARAKGGTR